MDDIVERLFPDRAAIRLEEFAKATKTSMTYVYNRVEDGSLRVVRHGKVTLIPVESVRAFLTPDPS